MENNESSKNNLLKFISFGIDSFSNGLNNLCTYVTDEEGEKKKSLLLSSKQVEEKQENLHTEKLTLNDDLAAKLFSLINKKTEEEFEKNSEYKNSDRREVINDDKKYYEICSLQLPIKQNTFFTVSDNILNEYKIDANEFYQYLSVIDRQIFEKKLLENTDLNLDEKPSKEEAKEAYILFGNKTLEQMKDINEQVANANPQEMEKIMEKSIIEKFRILDLIFLKYKITSEQLNKLIFEYDLISDEDVQKIKSELTGFEM